jgi:hypothetical protein
MVLETWTTTALPLLEALARGEVADPQGTTGSLIRQCNEDPTTQRTLAALIEDGYVAGAGVHWALGRCEPIIEADVLRLTPKGRRAVGQWPDGQAGDVLIRALEGALIELPEGETKSRIRELLRAARAVGTEVLTEVVAKVVKGTMGLA